MADIQNADSIRQWLRQCPTVNRQKRFGVDYLGDKPTEYGIVTIPSVLRTRENILGNEIPLSEQEQSFFLVAQFPYGQDISQNNANLEFYQDVCAWIWERNAAKEFPAWDGGRIKSIIPTLTADISRATAGAAEYRIQIKVTYRRS